MNKVLLFSDLQLTGQAEKMNYRLGILHQVIAMANAHSVDTIICAGDFFDITIVPPDLHTHVVAAMSHYNGCWVFVAGNHDQYGKLSTVLDPYSVSQRINIVTDISVVEDWLFVPYMRDFAALRKIIKQSKQKYLVAHVPLADQERSGQGLEFGDYKHFVRAFFGHYHVPSWTAKAHRENRVILGSPYVVSFDDARGKDDWRGVWIYDTTKHLVTRHQTKYKEYVTVKSTSKMTDPDCVYRLEIREEDITGQLPKGIRVKIIPAKRKEKTRIDSSRVHDTPYILGEYLKLKGMAPGQPKTKKYLKIAKELINDPV